MNINWGALLLVACATVVAAIAIVGLFALGVAALTAGTQNATAAAGHGDEVTTHRKLSLLTVAGYGCIGTAGLFALYGLYLIIPQFH
jgi:hypothetical protein